jgi:hypothetical protein
MAKFTSLGFAITAVGMLAGCGGGGDEGAPVNQQAAGIELAAVAVYEAKVDGGRLPIFQTLVVSPDGRAAIYYQDGFGGSRGFVDGTVSGANGRFSATLTDFASTGVFNGSASGTYRAGAGISATVTYPGVSSAIEFAFDSYPTLPTGRPDAVGTWNAGDERNSAQLVTVASDGTFAVAIGTACNVSGTATFGDGANTLQLASLRATAVGTGCRFGTGEMSGLMLLRYGNTRWQSLYGHLVRADRRDGFMLHSYRCSNGSTYSYLPLIGC